MKTEREDKMLRVNDRAAAMRIVATSGVVLAALILVVACNRIKGTSVDGAPGDSKPSVVEESQPTGELTHGLESVDQSSPQPNIGVPTPAARFNTEDSVRGAATSEVVRSQSTYLKATVEPCLPSVSSPNPCPKVGKEGLAVSLSAGEAGEWTAVTIEDDIIGRSMNERFRYAEVPHFVVRGVYEPGTIRCAVTGMGVTKSARLSNPDPMLEEAIADADARYKDDPVALKELPTSYPPTLITCMTDFTVHEYIAGRGPVHPRLQREARRKSRLRLRIRPLACGHR